MKLSFLICFLGLVISRCNSHSFSRHILNQGLKMFRNKIESIIDKHIENTKCAKDLRAMAADALHGKLWALKMLDASSKIHPGLLSGNINQFGNYDECLSIEEDRNNDGNIIAGQYCSVLIQPHEDKNRSGLIGSLLDTKFATEFLKIKRDRRQDMLIGKMKFVIGVCLPKSCSINNAQIVMKAIENTFDLPLHATFMDLLCDYKGKPVEPYDIDSYIELFFMVVIIAALISTLYDLLRKNKNEGTYLIALSLYTNSKKLLSTDCENRNLTCLHGLKVLAMLWIISSHKLGLTIFMGNTNSAYYFEWVRKLENSFGIAGFYAVDMYLIISGLLIMYIKLQMSEKHQVTIAQYYAHRMIRLMPALGATILFYISILKKLSHGPFWHIACKKICLSCYRNWLSTLFFATNIFPMAYQCVEQSWYLAVDTQLYWLSPIILFNVNKYPRKTLACVTIGIILSRIYSFQITYQKHLGAYAGQFTEDYFRYIYHCPLHQYTPWAMGILTGYFLYKHKDEKVELSKLVSAVLLLLSFGTLLSCILYHTVLTTTPYSELHAATFNALSNLLWSLGLCTIIILCCTGNAGMLNDILSAPIFLVLSKLTYSIFLIHGSVIFILAGFQKEAGNFNNLRLFREYFSDLILILFFATVWCLLFESPIFTILKIAERRKLERKKKVHKGTNTHANKEKENRLFLWGLSFIPTRQEALIKQD